MPAKVVLEVLSGPIKGRLFSFDEHDTVLFGRGPDCHAMLGKDRFVSRHHFLLEVNPPEVRLRDLGSRNGTFVNGIKFGGRKSPQAAEVDLRQGDRVTVGQSTIAVRIELPQRCQRCDVEIAKGDFLSGNLPELALLCGACRDTFSPQRADMPQRCQWCGSELTEKANPQISRRICKRCRARLSTETNGLQQLVRQALRSGSGIGIRQLDSYRIGRVLGSGGMGVVHSAVHSATGKRVAIKIMLPKRAVEDRARNLFLREINVLKQLEHPHIVPLTEHGTVGTAFYFVMEFCDQGNLRELMMRKGGRLSLAIAAPLMLQCLEGLEFAHRKKFVHRDVKPQNVLLQRTERRLVAKLSDFGLAKNLELAGFSGMTATGICGGTFRFMPREQLTQFKYALPVSDVWSMGATFYNMLTGCYPLTFPKDRDPLEVLLRDEPVPLRQRGRSIAPAIAAVIDRALATNIEQRFQSAGDMHAALRKALKK